MTMAYAHYLHYFFVYLDQKLQSLTKNRGTGMLLILLCVPPPINFRKHQVYVREAFKSLVFFILCIKSICL